MEIIFISAIGITAVVFFGVSSVLLYTVWSAWKSKKLDDDYIHSNNNDNQDMSVEKISSPVNRSQSLIFDYSKSEMNTVKLKNGLGQKRLSLVIPQVLQSERDKSPSPQFSRVPPLFNGRFNKANARK